DNAENISLEDKCILIGKGYSYKDFMKKLIESNNRVKEWYGTDYFITMGHDVIVWEDLHFSYESAKLLLDYQFLFGNESLVSIQVLEESRDEKEKISLEEFEDMVEIGDIEVIKENLNQLKKYYKIRLKKESDIKIQIINGLYQLYDSIKKYIEEENINITDIDETIELVKSSTSLDELLKYIETYLSDISRIVGLSTSDHVIKRIYAYMERNFHKNIKLESIAQLFNYNSAYLGKLFKKEIGESFNNSLDSIRIENAKRLLAETDLKVYQISEQVGYSNIDYFYTKFKKHVGISPKEFKRNL
ncbi:MAG: helix-turn-helix domain-containing protein, partial [Clostridiales bacterium]|nr:helix-turn-helix domain-containing protein [Clostridiales bacterium]